MRIDRLLVHRVSLPFSGDVSHSRRKGACADNVVVELVADQDRVHGYGEGAPRPYVTGESQESAAEAVADLTETHSFPWELDDASQIWGFVDSLPVTSEHNSAICAVEMALLDALGRRHQKSIVDYFCKVFYTSAVHYGATIPLWDVQRIKEVCHLAERMRISQLRVKMGKGFEQNREAIETVRQALGQDCDLRIDSNGAWDRRLAIQHVPLIAENHVRVVEQPMMPGDPDIAEFWEVMRPHGVILMADESVCSLEDLERIVKSGFYRMVNVRLSKCGGFRKSLNMIGELRARGVSFQVGCQLGESGLLSAAGRALSLLCSDAAYYDGSYDKFMLRENITCEDVSFGPGGVAGPLDGPGLGVTVNRESLMRLGSGSPSHTVSSPTS